MGLIEGFKIFKNGIDNWFEVAIKMFILKKESNCSIKNIGSVKLKKGKNYLNSPLFRALVFSNTKKLNNDQIDILKTYLTQIDNEIVNIINYEDKNQFKFLNNEIGLIFESFLYGDYKEIPYSVDNEYLIDIGANVGDSSIYFANKGYNVIALEPLPHICDIARKNIDLNPDIKDKIIFINKACSCKKGYININFNSNDTGMASEYKTFNETLKIETITIDDIIK
ncbi:FkbM family methyltransferase, partial [Methanobrevibacter sp.]